MSLSWEPSMCPTWHHVTKDVGNVLAMVSEAKKGLDGISSSEES